MEVDFSLKLLFYCLLIDLWQVLRSQKFFIQLSKFVVYFFVKFSYLAQCVFGFFR
jgi:hypothetical protein